MDKQNYTLKELKSQDVKKIFETVIEDLAEKLKSKNIIKRKRIIKDCKTLIQALSLIIVDNLSYQRLADTMAIKHNVVMSDTAWKGRLKTAIPVFYEIASEYFNKTISKQQKKKSNSDSNAILNNYNCYALDATNLPIEGEHSTVIRVHTQYSLNFDCIVYDSITDNHTAESTEHFKIEKVSLYVADRAYAKLKQLAYIMAQKADFIIRFSPSHIVFYEEPECKTKINIHEIISDKDSFQRRCYIKYQSQSFPVTIIGRKKPAEKHAKSEKKVRERARKNQQKLSQKTIDYSKWFFVVTSLDEELSDEVEAFYRLRWQIELFFKRTKSLLNFHKIKHSYLKHRKLIVTLWLTIAYIICSVKICLVNEFDFHISEYNLFSLIMHLFS